MNFSFTANENSRYKIHKKNIELIDIMKKLREYFYFKQFLYSQCYSYEIGGVGSFLFFERVRKYKEFFEHRGKKALFWCLKLAYSDSIINGVTSHSSL